MNTTKLAAVLALGFTACIDSSETTSATDQAATVFGDCETGSTANAMEYAINVGDSYTRSAFAINQTCDCRDWQITKNNTDEATANAQVPTCRPTTIVEFGLGAGVRHLSAEVDSWSVSGQTECENSTLNVKVQKFDWSVSDWVTIAGGASGDLHPTWTGTACQSIAFGQDVLVGTGGSDDFRIRARATRGLDQFDHGFEGVKVTAH